MFHKMNKSKNFPPGIICVLHTLGRSLQWNPHIHYLISKGGVSDDGFWCKVNFFSYTYLRNAFCTALLNIPYPKLEKSFKNRKSSVQTHKFLLSFNRLRNAILSSFGYDNLKRPKCGKNIIFLRLYFNHKPVSLQELYENVKCKHTCRSRVKITAFHTGSFHDII